MTDEISDIGVQKISVPPIPDWSTYQSQNLPTAPPVTVNIGIPIVDIPGCVEAHIDNKKSKNLPFDDDRGVKVFCDGGMPSFQSMDYRPEEMVFTVELKAPKINGETDDTGEIEEEAPPASVIPFQLPCPPPDAIPIGAKNKAQTKIIVGYKFENGECVTLYEPIPLPQVIGNHLPGAPIVITTTVIAASGIIGATLAKPLGDYLLKLIKPTLKKVKKKIAKILGKKEEVLSTFERKQEQRKGRK